eukprot:SAG25_NODE_10028_length_348_cov_0.811245_2_plen_39_part_01
MARTQVGGNAEHAELEVLVQLELAGVLPKHRGLRPVPAL